MFVMKKIFFTGGGSAGHVTPNIALIEHLKKHDWHISYIGSKNGIEHNLIQPLGIHYYSIATGKLRRYFDWQNFLDPFLIILGILQGIILCLQHRPKIVFSKGGFVAVPLVVGAWICRIPVISHESDITPGLANRLCFRFSRYICVNFPQTEAFLPVGKTKVTGSPVRQSLLKGDAESGRRYLGFDASKPILLIFGGSLGARAINNCVRLCQPELLSSYHVIHVVGEGNIDSAFNCAGYLQKEYLHEEFGDVLAAADIVMSRAGANSIYELLLTRKPHLLVPLSVEASRGDQIVNAGIFQKAGLSDVLSEDELEPKGLIAALSELYLKKSGRIEALRSFEILDGVTLISALIGQVSDT